MEFADELAGALREQGSVFGDLELLRTVKTAAAAFMANDLPILWLGMTDAAFKVVSQFWRVNIDPTERYVLSVAGATKYRLRANESGLTNVVLAGDWTNNGLNAGCVEAAAMSGIQASNVIQGLPLDTGIDGPVSEWAEWEPDAEAAAGASPNAKL